MYSICLGWRLSMPDFSSKLGIECLFVHINHPQCHCSQDTVDKYLTGIAEGWSLEEGDCGAESKEFLACMSWVGKRSAKKFNERVGHKLDRELVKICTTQWGNIQWAY